METAESLSEEEHRALLRHASSALNGLGLPLQKAQAQMAETMTTTG
jgi:hypothetical protein